MAKVCRVEVRIGAEMDHGAAPLGNVNVRHGVTSSAVHNARTIDAESLARSLYTLKRDKYAICDFDDLYPEFKRRRIAEAQALLNVAYDNYTRKK